MHLAYPYLIKNHHLTVQSPFVFWLLFNNHLKYLTGHGFTGLLDVWITLCTPLKSRTLVSVVYCSFQTIFWYIAKCSHKISECMHCPPSVMRFHFVLSRAVRAMVTLYIYVQIFSVNIQNHCVYYDYSDNGVHICIAIRLSCHTSEHVQIVDHALYIAASTIHDFHTAHTWHHCVTTCLQFHSEIKHSWTYLFNG